MNDLRERIAFWFVADHGYSKPWPLKPPQWALDKADTILALVNETGLREALTEYADTLRREKDKHYINTLCVAVDLDALLDATPTEKAPQKEAAQWIPVSERLPEQSTRVLIWYRRSFNEWRPEFGEISLGHWRPDGGNGNFDNDVLHWMPLPEPPAQTPTPPHSGELKL